MTRYIRNDAAVPWPITEDRAYEIRDERDRLLGVVAGHGRLWAAGRPRPGGGFAGVVMAESRRAAVDRLVRGRP